MRGKRVATPHKRRRRNGDSMRIQIHDHWTRVRVQQIRSRRDCKRILMQTLRIHLIRWMWTAFKGHLPTHIRWNLPVTRMCRRKARIARNVLHICGESELKFDVAIRSSYEGALIDGLPADKVKAGDEREIRQMKDLQLYSWIKETDVPYDKSVLLTGWARRMKGSEVRSRCVLKDFATTVRDDVFSPTPPPLSVRGLL